ncbi:penicillin-binding protein 2 [Candidatus Parcubacteria bacterium]|nr:penicillin-binding protein 2 [Candidatus Parcubacteria bacterium]
MIPARKKAKNNSDYTNRLNVVMAIIFLLAGILVYKLFSLQIMQYDLYTALAMDQHQVFNMLSPERGKIFIQDGQDGNGKYYPIATNKEYALVYAIPKKIENIEKTAEIFYEIFNKKEAEKEVDELLGSDEYFKELAEDFNPELAQKKDDINKKEKEEFLLIKKELEIKLRKEKIIENYKKKLSKKNDPYEPIRKKVEEEELKKILALNLDGVDYIMEEYRYYPEGNVGSHLLGFVGFNKDEKAGQYGLEGFFDYELSGRHGSIKAERSAGGGLIIIKEREYNEPNDGSDLILTINRSIQFAACEMLEKSAMRHGADKGTAIVMEPNTGAILAMCSWPNYDPNDYGKVEDINIYNNPAIFEQYEPGSIFKVITMAAGIDQEKVSPNTFYTDKGYVMIEGWPKPIKNSDYETHGEHGRVNMVTVLEESLNTGSIYIMEKTSPKMFADYVINFGFGEKTGIELETEGVSNIDSLKRKTIRPVEAATASFGQGITATPLQIVTAYSAVVNGGILMKPYVVSEIVGKDGSKQKTQAKKIRRVISEKAALLVTGMMVNVVDGGHAKSAGVSGYYVGGKTGTAQVADMEKGGYSEDKTIHSFVGFAPVENPRFVMIVKLDDPKDVDFSASSAAPLFGQIAEFILNYYQVPKER